MLICLHVALLDEDVLIFSDVFCEHGKTWYLDDTLMINASSSSFHSLVADQGNSSEKIA